MPVIGLKNFHVAKLTTEATNTYAVPKKLAPAIEASVTPNFEVTTLYGDDRAVAVAEAMGSIDIEINVADLSTEDYDLLMGTTKNADGIVEDHVDDAAPYLALGFELPKENGERKLYWYYKGRFQKPSSEHTTKGESVEFQTQTITGTFMAREDGKWRAHGETGTGGITQAVADAWFTSVYKPTPVV